MSAGRRTLNITQIWSTVVNIEGFGMLAFENTLGYVGFREYLTPSLVGFTIP